MQTKKIISNLSVKFFFFLLPLTISYSNLIAQSCEDLNEVVTGLLQAGKFAEIGDSAQLAFKLCSEQYKPGEEAYFKAENNLSLYYYYTGRYKEALALNQEILKRIEETKGKDHGDYGIIANSLGELYRLSDQYESALQWYQTSLKNIEKNESRNSVNYGIVLSNKGMVYWHRKQFSKADSIYLESLEIITNVTGTKDENYLLVSNKQVVSYQGQGLYYEALSKQQEVLRIAERTLGKQSYDYGVYLITYAEILKSLEQYEEALKISLEIPDILEKSVGVLNPAYAASLSNLATLYSDLGYYNKARPIFEKALKHHREANGEQSIFPNAINNLANLYLAIGQHDKADSLLQKALAHTKQTHGEEHFDYAIWQNNLASLYTGTGRLKEALALSKQTLQFTEKIFGKNHLNYAIRLHNQAVLLIKMEEFEQAQSVLLEARTIVEKAVGRQHMQFAAQQHELGVLYIKTEQYDKALPVLEEALEITKISVGTVHPEYRKRVNSLCYLHYKMGELDRAMPYLFLADTLLHQYLEQNIGMLSNAGKEKFVAGVTTAFHQYQSIFFKNRALFPKGHQIIYEDVLALKGLLLSSSKQLFGTILQAQNPSIYKDYQQWIKAKQLLAFQHQLGQKRDTTMVLKLEKEIEQIGEKMAIASLPFKQAYEKISWEAVRESLDEHEAAIEFVHFRYWENEWTDSTLYCALLTKSTYPHPKLIFLFEEKELESIMDQHANTKLDVNNLYGGSNSDHSSLLYKMIWQPIEEELRGVKKVYYAPDGLLHRISLGAIKKDATAYLSGLYSLNHLTSTRDLVFLKDLESDAISSAVIMGGIKYTTDEIAMRESRGQIEEMTFGRNRIHQDTAQIDSTRAGWLSLPGTLHELKVLEKLLKRNRRFVMTLQGYEASEEAFKAIGRQYESPDIIHIATHGFFIDDPEELDKKSLSAENSYQFVNNPLFRSGLIMAGANDAWNGKPPKGLVDDGILHAYEIADQNLSNTKLAVLSACESGLGDLKGNEGVYGLQRAFRMAGVDYLIMSLWRIPDKEPVEFMESFYKNWFSGLPIREAFEKAQQLMQEKYWDEPYKWGAFVLMGR